MSNTDTHILAGCYSHCCCGISHLTETHEVVTKSEREEPHSGETNQHAPTQTPCNQPAIAVKRMKLVIRWHADSTQCDDGLDVSSTSYLCEEIFCGGEGQNCCMFSVPACGEGLECDADGNCQGSSKPNISPSGTLPVEHRAGWTPLPASGAYSGHTVALMLQRWRLLMPFSRRCAPAPSRSDQQLSAAAALLRKGVSPRRLEKLRYCLPFKCSRKRV